MTFVTQYKFVTIYTNKQTNKQTNPNLHHPLSNNSVHSADVWYIAWLSLLSTNLSLFIQTNKQTNPNLHHSLSNNSVHSADVWYTAWLPLLNTILSILIQCNKHKHSPFTTLSVTILFTLLMSDTLHDFCYSVQICHFIQCNKQTNTNTHIPPSPPSQ